MIAYVVRRLLLAVLTVWAISVLSFMIIHLPPGDYVTSYIASMSASGSAVSEGEAAALREQLGLDKPITVQYAKWMGLIMQGNFGMAMEWGRPVSDVIGDRLTLTMVISVAAIIFTWGIALPIGIYSAVYPYSFLDYAFTLIGFIGLAIPTFHAHFTPCVEIGWRLAAEHWGRGLATEGAREVLRHSQVPIVSFTSVQNSRSRRVMEKLGMTHDPVEDFDHPRLPEGHPLRRHVLYRLQR